ncbi:hypothetical protein [Fusobacterium sp.]|uniref:PglD-related sugar-binding protein n=1 Tax=Fusobacterium sp. TaxID=68766 RepID=UPI00396C58F1
MNKERLIIIGAGGHARVVIDTVLSSMAEKYEILGFLDDGNIEEIYGIKKIGNISDIIKFKETFFHIALGNNSIREELVTKIGEEKFAMIIHKTAYVSSKASLGYGTYIGAMCVINANVEIGKGCIINTGTIIEHDSIIGDFVHLSYRVLVGSNCHISSMQQIEMGEILQRNVKL